MSLQARPFPNAKSRGIALFGADAIRTGAAHVPFGIIGHCGHAEPVALQLRAGNAATAFRQAAQKGRAVHAEAAGRHCALGARLALLVFHAAQVVALVLKHAGLKARGDAARNASRGKLGFVIAAGFLRGRQSSGGVGHIAPHKHQPQGGGGDWFQHRVILLLCRNMAKVFAFVMRNGSAMGARPCT